MFANLEHNKQVIIIIMLIFLELQEAYSSEDQWVQEW